MPEGVGPDSCIELPRDTAALLECEEELISRSAISFAIVFLPIADRYLDGLVSELKSVGARAERFLTVSRDNLLCECAGTKSPGLSAILATWIMREAKGGFLFAGR